MLKLRNIILSSRIEYDNRLKGIFRPDFEDLKNNDFIKKNKDFEKIYLVKRRKNVYIGFCDEYNTVSVLIKNKFYWNRKLGGFEIIY